MVPGAGTHNHVDDNEKRKIRIVRLWREQKKVERERLKRDLEKENFLTNWFVFSVFISNTRKEMLCVFLRKCKFLHFIHFKSSPLSIMFGVLKWS